MTENKTIFLVDDDLKLRRLVAKFLVDQGFDIREFPDGSQVAEALREVEPAAVILDIMLPGESGLDILRRIRQQSAVPVIMLTAKGDDEDRITGLELGADDYLPKPFNPRELVARINAVLRRSQPTTRSEAAAGDSIEAGGFVLLHKRRTVCFAGQEVELSATEHRLLEALMSLPGTVLSREALLSYARGKDFGPFDRSIDVHISKLRTKTEQLSGGKRCIKTVWGSGYMFEVDEP
ncbi:response regulator [Geomonas subterranea]|uniref:Response regulator transcription factor n=1 Tax=Geomonas subterranea TaxID=2847989 RepID=A0ABX8LHW6_9BACT|nr:MULTISPECIES: response regulator transcription factor [Geomonas]QXE89949.1 response regulator transcription factor [Geomonas subterranea]QXM07932.1 response regulator transcription factor [Geomonas subterranea]